MNFMHEVWCDWKYLKRANSFQFDYWLYGKPFCAIQHAHTTNHTASTKLYMFMHQCFRRSFICVFSFSTCLLLSIVVFLFFIFHYNMQTYTHFGCDGARSFVRHYKHKVNSKIYCTIFQNNVLTVCPARCICDVFFSYFMYFSVVVVAF